MSLENNVSVTALVISLIALVVALGQMLQQYLGTAEGYRRCEPSVIGPWANLRRRHWIWSEFRFETTYVAPHIVCATPRELQDLRMSTERGRAFRIVSPRFDGPERTGRELEITVHSGLRDVRIPTTKDHPDGEQNRAQLALDFEAPRSMKAERYPLVERDRSLSASWIGLIRQIHDVYVSYWPADCSETCRKARGIDHDALTSRYDLATASAAALSRNSSIPLQGENAERTDGAVVYRTWTWDFMPSDVTKPLATSTVSDVILLGLRLGMEWRTLDPGNSRLAADGCGASIQVFDMRGLGMVLRYTPQSHPRQSAPLQVIPSRAADKLLFGIVPGEPELVGKDVPMVTDDRKLYNDPPYPILAAIGLPLATRVRFRDQELQCGREITNETIALLCPFMPILNCSEVRVPGNLFLGLRNGVLHFWEGRYGLLKTLESIDRHPDSVLDRAYRTLAFLESTYESDFYNRWGETAIEGAAPSLERTLSPHALRESQRDASHYKHRMIECCRAMFADTIAWFKDRGFQQEIRLQDSTTTCTLYMALVASSVNMAGHVLKAYSMRNQGQQIDKSQEALRKRYTLPEGKYRWFVFEYYDLACEYGKSVCHPEYGVVKYIQERGQSTLTATEIEEAWWMLMVRGILWDICALEGEGVQQPIPSSLFENKTPVWII